MVSPVILFLLIVVTLLIIYYRGTIGAKTIQDSLVYSYLYSDLIKLQNMDMDYRLEVSDKAIYYMSRINSSGTVEQIMKQYNVTNMVFDYPVRLNYVKEQCKDDKCVVFNGTIVVPYPYNEFRDLEHTLDKRSLSSCIRNDCLRAEQCVNNLDTEEYNYTLIYCFSFPTRVKIFVFKNNDPISKEYPYHMFNDSAIVLS